MDADTEVRKRVHELKQRIEIKAEPTVQSAAARMIARTKPAGAADVLLAYVPFATDPAVVNDLCKALGSVTLVDGKVEPVVPKALEDSASAEQPKLRFDVIGPLPPTAFASAVVEA